MHDGEIDSYFVYETSGCRFESDRSWQQLCSSTVRALKFLLMLVPRVFITGDAMHVTRRDNIYSAEQWDGCFNIPIVPWERAGISGDSKCFDCHQPMKKHGWIKDTYGGDKLCATSYILTDPDFDIIVRSEKEFNTDYVVID